MSALTLPGNWPGLLRKGSPTNWGTVVALEARGGTNGAWVGRVYRSKLGDRVEGHWFPLDTFKLDLTEATGLQHAVWWLAVRFGLQRETATAKWHALDLGFYLVQVTDGHRTIDRLVEIDDCPTLAHAVQAACLSEMEAA